jgi:hemerythrin
MLLDPAQLPRLAVPFMNEDHAEEARLLEAVAAAVEAHRAGTATADQVIAALDGLYAHSRSHFVREEAAMEDASFPGFSLHQAEHERILGDLGEAERRFRETRRPEELTSYLATARGTLQEHVQTMDAAAAQYLSEWTR